MLARGFTAVLLAVTGSATGSAAEPEPALAPFAAHYTAEWRSINVGTSDVVLTDGAEPGRFVYTWTMTARGIFRIVYSNDVIQKSWLGVIGDHVRPDRYHAEQGDAAADIDFDWEGGHAHGVIENKPIDLKIAPGTQDVMSIQIEVMLDLKNGNLPAAFRILDRDEIKDFTYTQEGSARIRTALGELDTVVVSSHRAGNNRVLRMWFAPSLGYVPVQAERSRDGKPEFAMRIKTLNR